MRRRTHSIALSLAILSAASPAYALEELIVNTDQSQLLKLTKAPGTVVIGNPAYADITVQGNQLFLHGRSFGTTNLILLDQEGNKMAEYEVSVRTGGSHNLAVYRGATGAVKRASYICNPVCEGTIQIGDDMESAGRIMGIISSKSGLASAKGATERIEGRGGVESESAPPNSGGKSRPAPAQ